MSLNIPLIRASFEEVKPIAGDVASFFYKTLFESYPASQSLFERVDLENQKKALIAALATVVDHIDNEVVLVPYLKKMGARHVRYGTLEEHYPMVGKSLIATFRHFFGRNWTSELENEWVNAFGVIADCMIQGAKEAQVTSAPASPSLAQNIVSMPSKGNASDVPPSVRGDLQDLSPLVRQMAQNLLLKVLEQELDGEFMRIARKRAASILAQALREEADAVQEQFTGKKRAAS